MEMIAKCPHCGEELVDDDCFDTADHGDTYVKYLAGHCPQCDKEFQWKEIFDFAGVTDIEEC